MRSTSRRTFLELAAATTAAFAAWKPIAWASASGSARPMRAWQTADDRRFEKIEAPAWRATESPHTATIRIDAGQRFQEILGFGAAFTDASCYMFDQMAAPERKALLAEMFGADGLRLSVCRTCIGSSDYSIKEYSFDDGAEPDPELKRFSIEHDRAYILPSLRAARELNPDLFLFSSPWSPPGWMKTGGSMLGGSMRNKYFASYAAYFVKFLEGYAAESVRIDGVTVQNEVDTDQDGRMPAALWGQEYEISFVKDHLGPALRKANLDTKIWILDHNYALWGRAVDELSDPDLNRYVDGVAWHGYVGSANAMTRVHEAFPTKHAYWTEGGPDISSPDYTTDWTKWSQTFTEILHNWARCIVGWNLALDEKGNPNIGPFPCGGLVTVNSKTHELTRSGQYWAFAHYSKVIERGARVLGSQGEVDGVSHLAVENTDGSRVLVLTNRGGGHQVSVAVGNQVLDVKLPSDSVTTIAW